MSVETKARMASTPRARKARTRTKESTRVNESSFEFEGSCGHCGKWGHKQKDCRFKNTVAEVDEEPVEPSRPESHHHLLVCLQLEMRSPRRERFPH